MRKILTAIVLMSFASLSMAQSTAEHHHHHRTAAQAASDAATQNSN